MSIILHIMDYSAPYQGNFINSIITLDKIVSRRDGSLVYLFPTKARNLDWINNMLSQGKTLYFIDDEFFTKKIKYKNIKFLQDLIKKEKISIIHTHFIAYNRTLFLMKLFIIKKLYVIGHFHNTFLPPRNIFRFFKILIVKTTYNLIIGVSPSVADSLIDCNINSGKVVWILNAIDFTRLDTFEKVNLKDIENQYIILLFGWPFHRKGVDIVIEAISQLNHEGNHIMLAIALSGGNEIFEKEIINLVGHIPTWIKILQPRNDIATYYNASNIFISAGREEGWNYSVIEAAYCECQLIVSDIPGNPKDIPFIQKYEVANILQLKESIRELLSRTYDNVQNENLQQKQFVEAEYNINNWAEKVMSKYYKLS